MQPTHAALMARYNRWMNEKLYTVCAGLTDADRRLDRHAFFGSIHGTLNHLLLADKIWLGRFEGIPFSASGLDQELHAEFTALQDDRRETDERIENWAATLNAGTLAAPFTYTSLVNPKPRTGELWVLVTHFFNHQTHHRGQLTALLSQCGLDYGITDLLWMPGLLQEAS